jgi:hypothetical protein
MDADDILQVASYGGIHAETDVMYPDRPPWAIVGADRMDLVVFEGEFEAG